MVFLGTLFLGSAVYLHCVESKGIAPRPFMNGTEQKIEKKRAEGKRKYWVYTPSTPVKAVVLNVHAFGYDCDDWRTGSRVVEQADARSYMVITPCAFPAIPLVKKIPVWNAGHCCRPDRGKVNDIEFMSEILTKHNTFKVKNYAVGYSNGGMLTESLMCNNVVHSAVVVAGALVLGKTANTSLTDCDKLYKHADGRRFAKVHGTADRYVPWDGSESDKEKWFIKLGEKIFYGVHFVAQTVDAEHWASRMKCKLPVSNRTEGRGRYEYLDWACKGATKMEVVKVNGGKHKFFNEEKLDAAKYAIKYLLGK